MTAAERGMLLLTSSLGSYERDQLSVAQFRELCKRARAADRKLDNRSLLPEDLIRLGYSPAMAHRVLRLLGQEALLECYLQSATAAGCSVVTRASEGYPVGLRKRLGLDSPGCLWAKGDLSLLRKGCVAVVGSRDLEEDNRQFAKQVGRQLARQGFVLISGNARGTDKTAQEACLAAGGEVISVVADSLEKQPNRKGVLYLSEDCFDAPFTSQRALSRNRVIHALGAAVFVAQCSYGKGGTWQGSTENLRCCWNSVFCFDDGSEAMGRLIHMGAVPVNPQQLENIAQLLSSQQSLI